MDTTKIKLLKNRKVVTVILLLVTLGIGASAIFIGMQLSGTPEVTPEESSAAANPQDCAPGYLVNDNPKNDPVCKAGCTNCSNLSGC